MRPFRCFSPKKSRRRAAQNVAAATWDRRKAEKTAAEGGGKAHGVCRPGRDTAVRRKKDLIGLCEVVAWVR